MKQFEVGVKYAAEDCALDPILILRRTAKSVKVSNGVNEWMMRIRVDENGDEYVRDSSVGQKWGEMFTYKARWPVND